MNFYPRPPRGGRPLYHTDVLRLKLFLSTPSARRATSCSGDDAGVDRISIHALREEGDPVPMRILCDRCEFLSTPSARRATPRGAHAGLHGSISIHALREEGDLRRLVRRTRPHEFLSTPSARRATLFVGVPEQALGISIHALREEGDSKNRDKISIFKQIIQHSARI